MGQVAIREKQNSCRGAYGRFCSLVTLIDPNLLPWYRLSFSRQISLHAALNLTCRYQQRPQRDHSVHRISTHTQHYKSQHQTPVRQAHLLRPPPVATLSKPSNHHLPLPCAYAPYDSASLTFRRGMTPPFPRSMPICPMGAYGSASFV